MTKQAFFIPTDISADLNNTLEVGRANAGTLNIRLVPIEAIEFDPENPRELIITRDDINSGLKNDDINYETKLKELLSLEEMAETIKKYGVRNPVEIYKNGSVYRLVHGERRCLSSLLAGKKEIPAKVLDQKPNDYDIKVLQLIENVQRENLTLSEFLNNILAVIKEYKTYIDPNIEVDAEFLEKIINKSRSQCFNILAILNGPQELLDKIKLGKIKNLEKAALIATEKDKAVIKDLLEYCANGASISELKKMKQAIKLDKKEKSKLNRNKVFSEKTKKIPLGQTKSNAVISKIIKLVLQEYKYKAYEETFKKINLKDRRACILAFRTLIEIMEKEENK